MSPVGGSRHYDGGGLGMEAGWNCPSCGNENGGPIAQGCVVCGAGKPGRHIGREQSVPPEPAAPPPPAPPPVDQEQLGVFDRWALSHQEATLEEAFTAGYIEGVRAMRREQLAQRPRATEGPLDPESKIARTIVAALGYFTDQILSQAPPEVASGEWCSVEEVRNLIHQLTTTGEVAHA